MNGLANILINIVVNILANMLILVDDFKGNIEQCSLFNQHLIVLSLSSRVSIVNLISWLMIYWFIY